METKLRIVTHLPLRGLWRDTGPLTATRVRTLSSSHIRNLLLDGEVQFVVVDVGLKPRWIDLNDCYRFWMDEVQHHMVEPESKVALDQLPGCYGYSASEWQSEDEKTPIVVLELWH